MRKRVIFASLPIVVILFSSIFLATHRWSPGPAKFEKKPTRRPGEWFLIQRAYPQFKINYDVLNRARDQAEEMRARSLAQQPPTWKPAGPTNIGGRIADIAVDPRSTDTIYAGTASGGILKSSDGGTTWEEIFDDQPSLAIGAVAVDPNNPRTIYAGTGEPNAGGGSVTYGGYGVFKSFDGGNTWVNIGLQENRYIGRIVVDPTEPNRIFVAANGALFSTNPERGVYRSEDGGLNWDKVLYLNDSTGAVDVAINPLNPDTLYAAMWMRKRGPDYRRFGSTDCGLYRSTDGGDTWQELTGGLPGGPDVGRIGVSVCASNPRTLYAIYADATGYFLGVYKSTDGGDSWTRTNDSGFTFFYSSYGWWFGNVRVDPTNENKVFALGITMYRTTNGGASWSRVAQSTHVDNHAMYIHPANPNWIVLGDDGGVFISTNGGTVWSKSYDLPITQFYTIHTDFSIPQRIYGGTQDNSTVRTLTGNLDNWDIILGGDGFYVNVDPTNPNLIYAEYQWGNLCKSSDLGFSWFDATNGISGSDRRNWSTPVVMDPSNHNTLYYGTYRLYRTKNGAGVWNSISGDLTNGPGQGNITFGTITTIAVAASDSGCIYVGTDDSNVWVTLDGGANWSKISDSLPDRWVTRVAVDPYDALTAYVTFSGFKWGSPLPHVFRTTNAGATWRDISSNLPEAPVNVIVVDSLYPKVLYLGTDVGAFYSTNIGSTWAPLGTDLPICYVVDMALHNPTRTLLAGTYGRSAFKLDVSQIIAIESAKPLARTGIFELYQNHPNPFDSRTVISFHLVKPCRAVLEVYNSAGAGVRTLEEGVFEAGFHEIPCDGRDSSGKPLPAGSYIYRLRAHGFSMSRKMILLRRYER
ncbi:MAG: FlgD immunoglobulin-like domain containing protein [bacterium]